MSQASISTTEQYRLPTDLKPTHYDVTIKTDLETFTFDGFAVVDLDVQRETSEIIFNASQMDINEVSLSSGSSAGIRPQSVDLESKSERATVQFANPLSVGSKVKLAIGFNGKLGGSMLGYYISKYKKDGVEKFYALTQFEPTAARRAIPCWDEPMLKATFSIQMISRQGTVNLSNMPMISETPLDSPNVDKDLIKKFTIPDQEGWKLTKFEPTPPMSTYLVAFANGVFKYKESSYKSPLSGKVRPLRVYATEDLVEQTEYGLNVKARVLPVYEKIFDIEFPLPKLDTLVAHDFDSGAMENWGLITGRTSAYCIDPNKASITGKLRIASVQSHEVAHQWFGNIVTMAWWDNLWLNEGFATIMGEMIALNKIEPEWNLYAKFFTDHVEDALQLDGKRSSHPIEVPLENPDDINQVFDSLSYAKAGSVLRMLSEFVGEERFLKGVSIYLKKRLYGNSVTKDLWDGVAESTGTDIPRILNNWILKIGYPVVTVTESAGEISLRQDRFLEAGRPEPHENGTIWHIPLFLTAGNFTETPVLDRTVLLSEKEKSFRLDTDKDYLINSGARGFYRVQYPEDRLIKITTAAAKEGSMVTLLDRVSLISDAVALAKSGLAPTSNVLVLIEGLSWEREYLGFLSMVNAMSRISSIFWEDEEISEALKTARKTLFDDHPRRLGYEEQVGDSSETIQFRTLAIGVAWQMGDQDVINELCKRFQKFLETNEDAYVPIDLTSVIYECAVKHGGIKEYDAMVEIFRSPKSPQIKLAAINALCRNPSLLERTFELIKTEVADGDLIYFWNGMSSEKDTRRQLAEYTINNWDYLDDRFKDNFIQLQYFVKFAFQKLSSKSDADRVESFYKEKDVSKFSMALAQVLDTIRASATWAERSRSDVKDWLHKRQSSEAVHSAL